MVKIMIVYNTKKFYEIELPDGKKINLWFIGKQLELLLKEYNIPYKIKKIKRG